MRKLLVARFGPTALVAAMISVGLLSWGIAQAASGINGVAQPYSVAASSAGMPPTAQTLWAVVGSDGTKARALPVISTTSMKLGTGAYQVAFYENVDKCSYQLTIGLSGAGSPPTAYGTVAGRAGNTKAVFVQTFSSAGVITDEPFHIAVLC